MSQDLIGASPSRTDFAIVESMARIDYLVAGRIVSIYTYHLNLVCMYDTFGRNTGISGHTARKLMRWALKMNEFRY